jgi:DNA-binding beta-propeller fold protein YncE
VAESDGAICVADSGSPAIWIFDPVNQNSVKVRTAGDTDLSSPVAVAAGPESSFFVADSYLREIFALDRQGKFLRTVAKDGLERPAALAYDQAVDRLYVADSVGQHIQVYASDGRHIATWGKRGYGDGEFNYPSYLALEPSGTLLVTDALNYRVQAFDRNGKFLWKIGHHGDGSGDLASPKGVGVDSEGDLFVVDALFDAVQIFDREGALLLHFGDHGTAPGEFWLPEGMFINKQNRIYVADSFNGRIQVFELLGGSQSQPTNQKQNS